MYVIYAIILFGALYQVYHWRVAKLEKEKQILEEKVQLRTVQLRQANEEITAQRDKITAQRDEIENQRDLVVTQNIIIEQKNKNITDSIRYAQRIQQAILPGDEKLDKILKDYF